MNEVNIIEPTSTPCHHLKHDEYSVNTFLVVKAVSHDWLKFTCDGLHGEIPVVSNRDQLKETHGQILFALINAELCQIAPDATTFHVGQMYYEILNALCSTVPKLLIIFLP